MANTKDSVAKKTKTTRKAAAKAGSPAAGASKPEKSVGNEAVTINRRGNSDRRKSGDRRQKTEAVTVERRTGERRTKVNRRRQIDPTTCERDYSVEEVEFMNAIEEYKRTSGRMFPTCSEILEVVLKLGYRKMAAEPVVEPEADPADSELEMPTEDQASLCLVHESVII